MAKTVKVILGSVRTGRAGKAIADWVMKKSGEYQGDLTFELLDLKDINLPFMDEPVPPMASDAYVQDHTRQWSATIKGADAFLMVTPEYNGGYPPVLKNAIDFLYNEWQGKPVGIVAYAGGGGKHAVRQLSEVLNTIGMQVLDDVVTIGKVWDAVDEDGNVKPAHTRGDILGLFAKLDDAVG